MCACVCKFALGARIAMKINRYSLMATAAHIFCDVKNKSIWEVSADQRMRMWCQSFMPKHLCSSKTRAREEKMNDAWSCDIPKSIVVNDDDSNIISNKQRSKRERKRKKKVDDESQKINQLTVTCWTKNHSCRSELTDREKVSERACVCEAEPMIASFKNRKCQTKWEIPFFFRYFQLYGHLFSVRSLVFLSLCCPVLKFRAKYLSSGWSVPLASFDSIVILCSFFPCSLSSVAKDVIKIHISHEDDHAERIPMPRSHIETHVNSHFPFVFFFLRFKVSHLYFCVFFSSLQCYDIWR